MTSQKMRKHGLNVIPILPGCEPARLDPSQASTQRQGIGLGALRRQLVNNKERIKAVLLNTSTLIASQEAKCVSLLPGSVERVVCDHSTALYTKHWKSEQRTKIRQLRASSQAVKGKLNLADLDWKRDVAAARAAVQELFEAQRKHKVAHAIRKAENRVALLNQQIAVRCAGRAGCELQ